MNKHNNKSGILVIIVIILAVKLLMPYFNPYFNAFNKWANTFKNGYGRDPDEIFKNDGNDKIPDSNILISITKPDGTVIYSNENAIIYFK